MTALEEARAQRDKLAKRIREYQELAKTETDGQRRLELKQKVTAYRAAIRDIKVQIDHLDPPKKKKAQKTQRKRLDIGAMSFDFFERNNTVWSDLEGHSWQQVEAGDTVELGANMEQLHTWMAEGSERLTDRQRLYLDAYYNEGLSLEAIAQEHGVDRSTVNRVIQKGLARMQEWVDSKKLIATCVDGKGGFDWERYISQVPTLTDRQRQLMLLVLSKSPKTQDEIAEKLELNKSTVSKTLIRAGETIRRLNVGGGNPVSRPKIQWDEADKFTLAIQTGMPLYFYYRYCFRGQKIGGLSRYMYEISRRRESGEPPEVVAEELGLKVQTVRSTYGRLKHDGVRVGHLPPPDNIGARLNPETYVELQRLVTGRAGA